MSAPRILFIWDDIGQYGGVRTFLLNCLNDLPHIGFEVALFDLADKPVEIDEEVQGLASMIQPLRRSRMDSERSLQRHLHQAIRAFDPGLLVFVEWRHAEDVLACVPKSLPAINFCLVDRPDQTYYDYAKALVSRMELILGNSYRITRRLRETLDETWHPRIGELFIGVQVPENWSLEVMRGGRMRLVYMSRLNREQKRAQDLIPFVQAMEASKIPYELVIVGQGDVYEAVATALAAAIEQGRVVMTGSLPYPEAMQHFVGSDVFLLFSEYEGMPLVLFHALADGVVPVVSAVPSGVEEVIRHDENGLLFPVGDAARAAAEVVALYQEPARLARLKTEARRQGEQHSIQVTLAEFRKIVQGLFGTFPGPVDWSRYRLPGNPGKTWKARLAWYVPGCILNHLRRGS
ncbi:MAG: hypothetical protein ACI9TH_003604 [Kiritimatiellia bacterium]|jgi:hypothetical protein